jgi:hypothetical protein
MSQSVAVTNPTYTINELRIGALFGLIVNPEPLG